MTVYVETDFLLALAKPDDWLREPAREALESREVETSLAAFIELLLISERFEFNRVRACADLLELISIVPESDAQVVLKAAKYQEEHAMTAFDAVHATIAETRKLAIMGSEGDYEALDIDRIPLEGGTDT